MAPSTEPQIVSDAIKKKYADILKANGILEEVANVTVHEPESLKGEHMATISMYVNVEFKDPSKRPKNLFVKYFHGNPGSSTMFKSMRIMDKEASFFNDFLPDAREFCSKYPGCGNLLDFFPKCLYGDDEMVVLENVVLDDTFVMLPKEEFQDLFTAKLVLGNLAKFHASSAAMIAETGLTTFRQKYDLLIHEAFYTADNPILSQMFENSINTAINILKGFEVEGGQETLKALNGYLKKATDLVLRAVEYNPDGKLNVINHGDLWNNNMMFKKDSETGKVIQHMFVDLQITRMVSANVDIVYFLFSSVKADVRRNNLQELLQHYFEEFKKTLQSLERECAVTFEDFFKDFKNNCILGLFMNITVVTGQAAMKDIDMNDMSDDPNGMMDMLLKAINNWIKKNPDKVSKIGEEIVAVHKEFLQLISA